MHHAPTQQRQRHRLNLVPELSPGSDWRPVIEDAARRSWAYYHPSFWPPETLDRWFATVKEKTAWQKKGTTYPTAWYVIDGCNCSYKYGNANVKPIVFPDWLQEIRSEVCAKLGIPHDLGPNSCNLNHYRRGKDDIWWHRDSEFDLGGQYDSCIISLSLGAKRTFEVRLRKPGKAVPRDHSRKLWQVPLGEGDICTMEGSFQMYYEHRVPPEKTVKQPRINLTWRWIRRHKEVLGCTKPAEDDLVVSLFNERRELPKEKTVPPFAKPSS